jgi:hypothetical protein
VLSTTTAVSGLFACGGESPAPKSVPLAEVLDCTGIDDSNAIFPVSHTIADAGHTISSLALSGAFAGGGPDSGAAFSDVSARLRAATVCACRAKRNRDRASADTAAGDTLVILGGVGTVGGGALNGVAATGVDDTARKTLLTSGVISMGVGALAFGINSALAFNKRATTLESSAADQEYAAAVLWNDSAGTDAWSRAWSACVTAEGTDVADRLANPVDAFSQDAGVSGSSDASGGSPPEGGAKDSAVLGSIQGVGSVSLDGATGSLDGSAR